MKKLLAFVVLAAMAYGGWCLLRAEPAAADKPDVLFNRFWIDHMPTGEKDTVRAFALWKPESFGVFADQNMWRVELERFRYEAQGDEVHAIFPLSGDREEMTVKAHRCAEADWDFCLEVFGSKHGTTRYYSRLGWERRDRGRRDVDQFVRELRR